MARSIILKIKTKIVSYCLKYSNTGSILLEAAIAISIITLLSGALITKIIAVNKLSRSKKLTENMDLITISVASFVATNYRLPRAANANGIEQQYNGIQSCVGTVPYITLGIPKKNTLDADGKPLIYIAEYKLTQDFKSIYDNQDASNIMMAAPNYFCMDYSSTINLLYKNQHIDNEIAFVLDTCDNYPSTTNSITIHAKQNTKWTSRNAIFMQYLKCKCCMKN